MKSKIYILTAFSVFCFFLILSGCTKNVPPDMMTKKTPITNQDMPSDSIHKNLMQNQSPHGQNQTQSTDVQTDTTKGDPKADQMMKDADDADAKYQKTKSDADKKICIEKQMAAANYLMFEANLTPKKKYRPALKRYKRVVELDPNNAEANENKAQIEDIYRSMGMPIPD